MTPGPAPPAGITAAHLAAVPGAALAVEASGRVIGATSEALDLLDASPVGLTTLELFDVALPPVDAPARGGIRRGDRIPRVVELRAGAPDADGTRIVAFREMEAPELLAESQRGLDAAFAHAPIGMAIFDVDGRFVRANDALGALLSRPPAELIGIRDQELTHPDDRQVDVDAAWLVLDGKMDTWRPRSAT